MTKGKLDRKGLIEVVKDSCFFTKRPMDRTTLDTTRWVVQCKSCAEVEDFGTDRALHGRTKLDTYLGLG